MLVVALDGQVVERAVLGEHRAQQVAHDAVHAVVGADVGDVEHERVVVALQHVREDVVGLDVDDLRVGARRRPEGEEPAGCVEPVVLVGHLRRRRDVVEDVRRVTRDDQEPRRARVRRSRRSATGCSSRRARCRRSSSGCPSCRRSAGRACCWCRRRRVLRPEMSGCTIESLKYAVSRRWFAKVSFRVSSFRIVGRRRGRAVLVVGVVEVLMRPRVADEAERALVGVDVGGERVGAVDARRALAVERPLEADRVQQRRACAGLCLPVDDGLPVGWTCCGRSDPSCRSDSSGPTGRCR